MAAVAASAFATPSVTHAATSTDSAGVTITRVIKPHVTQQPIGDVIAGGGPLSGTAQITKIQAGVLPQLGSDAELALEVGGLVSLAAVGGMALMERRRQLDRR